MEQLHVAAWQIMADELSKVKQHAIAQYEDAKGAKRASDKLGKVLQAAHEGRIVTLLVDVAGQAPAIRDAAFDPFRHQLVRIADLGLEVAVGAAVGHGGERAHAAVGLELLAVDEDTLAREEIEESSQQAEEGR
jgi:hypothetical protein